MANIKLILDSKEMTLDQKATALLVCQGQEKVSEANRLLSGTGLSLLQVNLLHALSKAPEKTLTVNQLKALMVEDSPNVSRTLNKLADNGLVQKQRSTSDQRTVFISITSEGEKAHTDADKKLEAMGTGLSDAELKTLCRLLAKL
jgi:DNA-binding MarR family transcriptional regulator